MSEHAWILENIAGYCAGGLDAAERERFEAHTATCGPCAQALADGRATDEKLASLFARKNREAGVLPLGRSPFYRSEVWLLRSLRKLGGRLPAPHG